MSHLSLKYLYAGTATYMPGDRFGPRTLANYEMVWITAGDATYHTGGRRLPAPAGSMLLTRPGFHERYDWDPVRTTRHAFFHFDAASWPSDWPGPEAWPILRTSEDGGVEQALFAHVMRLNERYGDTEGPPPRELTRQVEALISAFIHELAPSDNGSDTESGMPPPVMRAMDWTRARLRESLAASIDLDALAGAASVTPKHLCRLFSRSVGQPPMHWVLDLRLDHARTLLRRSNLSVQEVGHRCGFASPFHFSRAYKRRYGRPPTADRKLGR